MVRSLNTRSGSTARSADNASPESLTPRHWLYFSLITLVLLSDGMDVTIVAHVFPTLIKSWGVSVGGGVGWWLSDRFAIEGEITDVATKSPFESEDFPAAQRVQIERPHNIHTTAGIRYRF